MIAIVVLLAGGALAAAEAQAPDSTLLRPTEVTARVSNDPHLNGTYRSRGVSTKCGLADYGYPHRANSFAVEFPDDPSATPMEVAGVTFDADTLASGTTRSSFYLSIRLDTPRTGRPPALVVRANEPRFDEPGTVTRASADGTETLTIVGTATSGTKVRLEVTIVCRPRPA
jgi:hypothetical protein